MAIVPVFDPEGRPTDPMQVANAAANTMSSIMDRVQASQRANTQLQMQQQQFEIEKPVMMAQAEANIATYGAQLASTQRMANLRTEFMSQSPQIMDEYEGVGRASYLPPPVDEDGNPIGEGAPDWAGAYDSYQALAAKYAQFSVLPEGKQLIDSIQKSAFDAHANFIADTHMKGQQVVADTNYRKTVDAANINAEGKIAPAQITAGSRQAVADTTTGGRVQAAEIHAGARQSTSTVSAYTEIAKELDSAAEKEGDPTLKAALLQKAQSARDAVTKQTAPPPPAAAATQPAVHIDLRSSSQKAATEVPAQEGDSETESDQTPTDEETSTTPSQPLQPKGRLYTVVQGHIQPPIGEPGQVKLALQQAVDDGLLTTEQARAYLISRGFRPKGQ